MYEEAVIVSAAAGAAAVAASRYPREVYVEGYSPAYVDVYAPSAGAGPSSTPVPRKVTGSATARPTSSPSMKRFYVTIPVGIYAGQVNHRVTRGFVAWRRHASKRYLQRYLDSISPFESSR